jgi:hypothetical protein
MNGTDAFSRGMEQAPAVEEYTPARIAEFLLNNAVDADDERWAASEARRIGIDPAAVPRIRA